MNIALYVYMVCVLPIWCVLSTYLEKQKLHVCKFGRILNINSELLSSNVVKKLIICKTSVFFFSPEDRNVLGGGLTSKNYLFELQMLLILGVGLWEEGGGVGQSEMGTRIDCK